jgi:hypothetical protein
MKFEYEISLKDYVSSQRLFQKLSYREKVIRSAITSTLTGTIFIFIASDQQRVAELGPLLLACVGAWWIFSGLRSLVATWNFRSAYKGLGLTGEKFQMEADEKGFEVNADTWNRRIQWSDISLKGENKHVFIVYPESFIYMIGKQYLTEEQQQEFRKLAGLTPQ